MDKILFRGSIIFLCFLLSILLIYYFWLSFSEAENFVSDKCNKVLVKTDLGNHVFDIEIADSYSERSKGLMNRKHLAINSGMLFVYDEPRLASFWMKNTHISLDIIFINNQGIISQIHRNAIAFSEDMILSTSEVKSVLEINGGLAKKLGLSIGSKISHTVFGNQCVD